MMPLRRDALCAPVLRAYLDRLDLDVSVLQEDGRLRLRVDHRHGIDLQPVSGGQLALLATIADLTTWPAAQVDTHLLALLGQAAGLMREHASGLVIDERRQQLQLQQVLPADTQLGDLEQALEDFLNVLDFWVSTWKEAARPAVVGPGGWR